MRNQRWGRDIDALQAEVDDSYQNRPYCASDVLGREQVRCG
jgi:hypothetical protein